MTGQDTAASERRESTRVDSRDDTAARFAGPGADVATLPGLEYPTSRGSDQAGELVTAIDITLEALAEEHSIGRRDAGRVALARNLARIIEHKRMTGRTSTVGNDARVLMDILDGLAPAAAAEGDAALRAAMAEWAEAEAQRGPVPDAAPA